MDNMSLSDIAAVTRDNDGNGWGSGSWWIIVLFLFAFMGNGLGFNRGPQQAEPVTESGLCSAMNFNDLQNAVGRLSDQNQNQTTVLGNGICNLGYEMQGNVGQLGKEMALAQAGTNQRIDAGNYALSNQLSECCCTTQRAIDGVKFDTAQGIAAVNANIDAKFAAMEKAQLEQTIAAQQNQINQLNLQAQMCGVVRYPSTFAYSAGANPFCGCGTGCGATY